MNNSNPFHLNGKEIFFFFLTFILISFNTNAQYFFEEYPDVSGQGFCSEDVKQTSTGYLLYGKKENSNPPQFLTLETDFDGNQISIQQINFSNSDAQYQRLEDGNFIKEYAIATGIRVEKIAPDESVIWAVDVDYNNNFSPVMANGILENAQGDIFVGFFRGSSPAQIIVSKINSVGTLLWSTNFDANQYNISNTSSITDMNMTVALDDNGVAVDFYDAGSFFSFNRVVKLDAQGVYEYDNYSGGFPIPNGFIFEPGINGNFFTRRDNNANYYGSARSYSYTGDASYTWNPNYNTLEYSSFSSGTQRGIPTAIEATADGGLLIGGFKTEFIEGVAMQEMFLVKANEFGEMEFTNVNFPFVGKIKNIKEFADGNIMLSGLRNDKPWMMLVNSDGNPSTQSCPTDIPGYTFEGTFRGHNYFLSEENSNYQDALLTANNNGGYVFSIEDNIENGKVFGSLPDNTSAYIGLNDLNMEGSPEWANGQPYDYDNTAICPGCDVNTNENNVTTMNFWNSGKWSWESGDAFRPHLMERDCDENNADIANDLPIDLGFQGCIANVAVDLLQSRDRESEISSTAIETGLNTTNWWKAIDGDMSTFVESQLEENPTWRTQIFYDFWVDEIRIHPRADGQFPLENIRIQISTYPLVTTLDTLLVGVPAGETLIFPVELMARGYVTIIKEGQEVLSFSEIEIIGCPRDIAEPLRFECPKDMVVNAGPSGTYTVDYDDDQFQLDCLGSGNGGISYRGPQEGDEILPGDYLYEIDSGNDVCGLQYCNIILTVLPFDSGNGEITINCPNDVTVIAPANSNEAVVNWNLPEATTTCTAGADFTFNQQLGLPNGSVFQLGTYTIEYAVSDACGNIKNCSFSVNVETASNTTCPDSIAGYILLGEFENHKYYLSRNITNSPFPYTDNITTVGNWPTSAATAMANGGYLASINSAEENQFIYDKIGNTSVFIGLSDLQGDGTYEWESEEPITYTNYDGNFPSSVVYGTMNFWQGTWTFDSGLAVRPHILEVECGTTGGGVLTTNCPADISLSIASGETSVVANFNAPTAVSTCTTGNVNIVQVNGINSGSTLTAGDYMIEYEITDGCGNVQSCNFNIMVTGGNTGGGCPQNIAGFTALGEFGNSKYFISDEAAQPTAAQITAAANNGFLAVINDQAENDFIQQNISEMVYIGLNDAVSEGNLAWVNGEPLNYNNVNPCSFCNENLADLDYVIMAPWDGAWSFSSIWNQRKYVMEVPCDGDGNGNNLCSFNNQFTYDENLLLEPITIQETTSGYEVDITYPTEIQRTNLDTNGEVVNTESLTNAYPSSVIGPERVFSKFGDFYYLTAADGNQLSITLFDFSNNIVWSQNYPDFFSVTPTFGRQKFTMIERADELIFAFDEFTEVIKTTTTGQEIWRKNILDYPQATKGFKVFGEGNNGSFYLNTAIEVSDHLYMIKMDMDGNILWDNLASTYYTGNQPVFIGEENDGSAVYWGIVGFFGHPKTTIIKHDANDGSVLWLTGFPPNLTSHSTTIKDGYLSADDQLLIGMRYVRENENRLTFNYAKLDKQTGGIIWRYNLPPVLESLFFNARLDAVTSDGGGIISVQNGGNYDLFKFNADGKFEPTCGIASVLPDLRLDFFRFNPGNTFTTYEVGETIKLVADLINTEFGSVTGDYNVAVYFSSDEILSSDDFLVIEYAYPSMGFDYVDKADLSFAAPNIPTGEYHVFIKIDDAETVVESNENNNVEKFFFPINITNTNSECPTALTDFTYLGEFNGSAYFLSDNTDRPADAQIIASQNGGHLAVINSQAENDFLFPQINELVYIGMNDFTTEGTLAWGNGDPVDFTNFNVCSFCNENSADMDFVVMHSWDGAWSWSNFFNQRKYIVEIPCGTNQMLSQNTDNSLISYVGTEQKMEKLSLQKIHPNPANDFIFITLESPTEQLVGIQIFDARGALVRFEKLNLYQGKSTNEISISELPAGVYSIYIPQLEGVEKSQRFVKLK